MRYLLLATIATVLFFGAYWLLMRKETRFTMVRLYLLGTLLLAMVLPLIHVPLSLPLSLQHEVDDGIALQSYSQMPGGTSMTFASQQGGTTSVTLRQSPTGLNTIEVRNSNTPAKLSGQQLAIELLGYVYIVGCAIMLWRLISRLLRLRKSLRRLPYRTTEEGIRISELDDDTPAYSFGRRIVVGRKGFSPSEVQQLVGHERVHVRQCHTVDLLLCELAKVMLWFNPFVWLYQRELKRVHEYIADRAMLTTDRGADYAALFYHQVSGKPYCAIDNTFDYRMVRQRIGMMGRRRSRSGWLKPLVALPLVAVVLIIGCQQKGVLNGYYAFDHIALLSDNPAEPALVCSEYLGLENQMLCFDADGSAYLLNVHYPNQKRMLTYTIDDDGLHLYDSTGNTWLDMELETVSMTDDSIVMRLVDPNPLEGLAKTLKGIPTYKYRLDTVAFDAVDLVDGKVYNRFQGTRVDTTYACVAVRCESDEACEQARKNRLLRSAVHWTTISSTQYRNNLGRDTTQTLTMWEFTGNALVPDARERYDTSTLANPLMKGDRFILELVLHKVNPLQRKVRAKYLETLKPQLNYLN